MWSDHHSKGVWWLRRWCYGGNYYVLSKYDKWVLPFLTWMVGPTNQIQGGTHHSCLVGPTIYVRGGDYVFMILREYLIIFHVILFGYMLFALNFVCQSYIKYCYLCINLLCKMSFKFAFFLLNDFDYLFKFTFFFFFGLLTES